MPFDGAKAEALRERRHLTQQDAAERAGWTGPNARIRWAALVSGRKADPRISTVEKMAAALGVEITELISPKPMAPAAAQKRRRPSSAAGSKG